MKADSPLWRVMGEPAQAHEAAALEKLRSLLPDDGVARAWANVTFTDQDGRLNEIDALVVTRSGILLVELKGWHGTIAGDQQTWLHAGRSENNPRKLANAKAKRLAGVLKHLAHSAGRGGDSIPFIEEAVVLHGEDSVVQLDAFAREAVWALDGYRVRGLEEQAFSRRLAQPPSHQPIDGRSAKVIDKLMEAAGLMPRPRQRMIGQYLLESGDPLGEGPGWQDYLVRHPRAKTQHRVRLFPYPKGADRGIRAAIDQRAEREFRLTFGLAHPGIIGPSEFLTPEEGPALVFAHDEYESSLEAYLEAGSTTLTFEARERIVQQLIELVRFAHAQRLTHRALSPLSVRTHGQRDGHVVLRIRDWDLARRPEAGSTTATAISAGLTDVVGAVNDGALVYLAPETLRGATPASAQSLDVYGVGALAYLVLTGRPPADNVATLERLVGSGAGSFDPRAALPSLDDAYALAIMSATAFQELDRTIDIAQLQSEFEIARKDVRGGVQALAEGDPLDAGPDDIVDGRFLIVRRRGAGSTGVALEVYDEQHVNDALVLKLGKDDSAAARLHSEALVLDRLDHPRIVRRVDGPMPVGTRTGLLLTDAGVDTLADRIRLEGRATIEQLERYAADLFEAVAHLESRGVVHRDIKPANLAVNPDPATRRPRLTLFDFSLAEEPLTSIRSGSRPYLDPYLGSGGRPEYDSAAERFAISATLFELATGQAIWWEQGDAPASADDAVVVQTSMFDPGVAADLAAFFTTALAPRARERHSSLEAMRIAWTAALAAARDDASATEANDERAEAATLSTPLSEAGLSTRALSALGRIGAETVGELLGVPPMTINQTRGIGEQVRREISARIRLWRSKLAATTEAESASAPVGRVAVENLMAQVASRPGESLESRFLRLRKSGVLRPIRADARRWLHELGGTATLDELAARLLREYGSTLGGEARLTAATEVVRAIVEYDGRTAQPQLLVRTMRHSRRVLLAEASRDEGVLDGDDLDVRIDALEKLSARIDALLATEEVVGRSRLLEARQALTVDARVPEARLTQLAVGLTAAGALSSMGEVYRSNLAPGRAVELALRGAGSRTLALVTIEQRVRARFPEATGIPARPALDTAVRAALPHLEWKEEEGKYGVRAVDDHTLSQTGTTTTWGRPTTDPAVSARLAASIRDRGPLTLVHPRRLDQAVLAQHLAQAHGLVVVDLADLALEALRGAAEARRVDWSIALRADAAPDGSQDQRNLRQLARIAITPAWDALTASPAPTLLLNAAVLARLELTDLLAQMTDLARPRPAARWFLLPRPFSGGTPDLDGRPMPFGADGWIELADHADVSPAARTARPTKGDPS